MATQAQTLTQPKVIVKKVVHAKRERVFEAWTKPELMQKWMIPGPGRVVSKNDLRVGGRYEVDMIFDKQEAACEGIEKSDGVHYLHTGEYLEITPPSRLVFTWTSPAVTDTRVTVELRDLGDTTEVTVTHELIESEHHFQSHTQGWEGCLANLAAMLG